MILCQGGVYEEIFTPDFTRDIALTHVGTLVGPKAVSISTRRRRPIKIEIGFGTEDVVVSAIGDSKAIDLFEDA